MKPILIIAFITCFLAAGAEAQKIKHKTNTVNKQVTNSTNASTHYYRNDSLDIINRRVNTPGTNSGNTLKVSTNYRDGGPYDSALFKAKTTTQGIKPKNAAGH